MKVIDYLKISFSIIWIFIITFFLICSAGYGFDFSDESYYGIGYFFKEEPLFSVSFFHRIYNELFGFLNLALFGNRMLGVVLTLLSSLLLGLSVSKFFDVNNKRTLILFSCIIGFLSYTLFPMTISYNLFSTWFVSSLISVILLGHENNLVRSGLIFGFLCCLIILNKFTNVLFIAFFLVSFLLLFKLDKSFFLRRKFFVFLFFGILFTLVVMFRSVDELAQSFINFKLGLSYSNSHSILDMISTLERDAIRLFKSLKFIVPALSVLIIVAGFFKVFLKKGVNHLVLTFVDIVIILNLAWVIHEYNGFIKPYDLIIFYWQTLVLILIYYIFFNLKNLLRKESLFGMLLLLLPFIASLGTNNSLTTQFVLYGNVFGVGFFLLLNNIDRKRLSVGLMVLILLVCSYQIYQFKVYRSYRLKTDLFRQDVIVDNVPYLDGISVDSLTNEVIQECVSLKTHPSNYIFLTSHELGMSLLTEKQLLAFSWINKKNYNLLKVILNENKSRLIDDVLFVLPSDLNDRMIIIDQLNQVDVLEFEKNYVQFKKIRGLTDSLYLYEKR